MKSQSQFRQTIYIPYYKNKCRRYRYHLHLYSTKFQFNSSSLKIKDSKVDFKGGDQEAVEAGTNGPASYQVNGTDGDLTAKIVDVGMGSAAEYEEAGFEEGDIALAQVDQSAEAWINIAMKEADAQGAAALVSWANSGYGEAGTFTNNTQDVCCGDRLPSVSVSADQAKMIKRAIKNGHDEATLNVDAEMVDNGGTTYNVCGMIEGKNHDQKIIVSGHYDKYWYGFQDDCAAMGLVFGVAKALVESGYEPENDIYFVAHGAEEWGVTDSVYDWTTGAWGMVDDKGMADDVICMLNFELPAFHVDDPLKIACVPEFSNTNAKILKEGIVVTAGDVEISYDTTDTTTMEDGISYREYGTPYFLNGFEGTNFMCDNYHTIADNKDTYDADVFTTNMNWCGAYAIYADNTPAVELDFRTTANRIKAGFNADYAKEADVSADDYAAAIKELKTAGKALNAKAAEINDAYAQAMADGDKDAAKEARAAGTELNKKSLDAFQKVQDSFLKVTDFGSDYGHTLENANVECIDGILAMLEAGEGPAWGEDGDGYGDMMCVLNAAIDYYFFNYSYEVGEDELNNHTQDYYADKDQAMWGWNHMPIYANTCEYSAILAGVEDISELSNDDVKKAKTGYKGARTKQIEAIGSWCTKEIAAMKDIARTIK